MKFALILRNLGWRPLEQYILSSSYMAQGNESGSYEPEVGGAVLSKQDRNFLVRSIIYRTCTFVFTPVRWPTQATRQLVQRSQFTFEEPCSSPQLEKTYEVTNSHVTQTLSLKINVYFVYIYVRK
jgi:hypothetical protein